MKEIHWLLVLALGSCVIASACSVEIPDPGLSSSGGTSGGHGKHDHDDGGDDEPLEAGGGPDGEEDGGGGGGRSDGGLGTGLPGGATTPNLKVAFLGDTASGPDFKKVLQLVKAEKAELILIQGDLTYDGEKPADWFAAIDPEVNTAASTIPFIAAKGNHDSGWSTIAEGLEQRMAKWGVAPTAAKPTAVNYAVNFKGLSIVMVSDSETSPTRAEFIDSQLKNDKQIWKFCGWHKNQKNSNVGGKSDEMGWATYETCRKYGAIVGQGHSHTYSRSKTITNDATQAVDPTCATPFDLCVGPDKHFFFDSSMGGHDMRSLSSVAQNPYWGSTYAGGFGALFLTFNVGGDPRKAEGYFKTIGGVIADPPASSGKTKFTITAAAP